MSDAVSGWSDYLDEASTSDVLSSPSHAADPADDSGSSDFAASEEQS